jgi:hypothetical protein
MDADDFHWSYINKNIDDFEERIRHLEANNKEQSKLFVISEKLGGEIRVLDDKQNVRFNNLEKWMDGQIAVVAANQANRKEHSEEKKGIKEDLFGIAALCISIIVLVVSLVRG